jgi:hypothetical protein
MEKTLDRTMYPREVTQIRVDLYCSLADDSGGFEFLLDANHSEHDLVNEMLCG